ncbi:MAG: electron transfer flavoprotein subunit beta/FixA family protein [Chloroflexi bacterium]|nr:electron transfer flavoprotein subunit beta/FixA family protein [Chloroflexota bacterium]
MNIVVPIKLVPDLVEELTVDAEGACLDADSIRLKLNEFDDHALEQAILLKEKGDGEVTVIAIDADGVDEALYAAAAKGADRLIKLLGTFGEAMSNHALARIIANAIEPLRPELILTGVQAHNDLDGSVGPQLAEHFGMPYVGYVSGVAVADGAVQARKEYPGGLIAQMVVTLPAVIGIQAAEKPPRYVPISKIRQTTKTAKIETRPAAEPEAIGARPVTRMFQPEPAERATMIEGDTDRVATRLVEILQAEGVL